MDYDTRKSIVLLTANTRADKNEAAYETHSTFAAESLSRWLRDNGVSCAVLTMQEHDGLAERNWEAPK